jgi:hypothetical protein
MPDSLIVAHVAADGTVRLPPFTPKLSFTDSLQLHGSLVHLQVEKCKAA